jgi:hypothetical protein
MEGSQAHGSVYPHPSPVYNTVSEKGPGVGVGAGVGVAVGAGVEQASRLQATSIKIPNRAIRSHLSIHIHLITDSRYARSK